MNLDENFILLRKHRLFSQLTQRECNELNIVSGFLKANKNEFVYLNKLKNDRLYFLKKGYVKVGYYNEQGDEVVKEILKEGDIFGQLTLDYDNTEDEFAQIVKKDAVICSFKIDDFEKMLSKKPELAISFTKLMGLKFKTLQMRLVNIMHKDVNQRLIDFFIYLSEKNRKDTSDEFRIENYLTHADIAGLIGSTRQTVTSMITKLQERNLIHFSRQEIVIPSLKALKTASFQ